MDSERELKSQFRRALDEVLPAAPWLDATVMNEFRRGQPRRVVARKRSGAHQARYEPRRSIRQLVAVLLILAMAAAGLAALLELRSRTNEPTPAGANSIKAYQTMVSRDRDNLLLVENTCTASQPGCPGGHALAALQRWLDDLDRSTPPPRFAVIDAQMRRHLAASITNLTVAVAAYEAQDNNRFALAQTALSAGDDWLAKAVGGIAYSRSGTLDAYLAAVQEKGRGLGLCGSCQSLAGSGPIVCTGGESTGCAYESSFAESFVGDFESSLVSVAAPASIGPRDLILQRDLAQADTDLMSMLSAALDDSQTQFDAARMSFQTTLTAITTDIGAVLASS